MPQALASPLLTAFPSGVVRPKKPAQPYTFGVKLDLWLRHHGEKLPAFAKRAGIPYASLHAYTTTERRISAERLFRIAAATNLPADYWTNDALPYPPPSQYGPDAVQRANERMAALDPATFSEWLEVLEDPDDVRRTLALRRAAKGWRPKPPQAP